MRFVWAIVSKHENTYLSCQRSEDDLKCFFHVKIFFSIRRMLRFFLTCHSSKLGKHTHGSVCATFPYIEQVQVDNFVYQVFLLFFFEIPSVAKAKKKHTNVFQSSDCVFTHHFHVNRRSTHNHTNEQWAMWRSEHAKNTNNDKFFVYCARYCDINFSGFLCISWTPVRHTTDYICHLRTLNGFAIMHGFDVSGRLYNIRSAITLYKTKTKHETHRKQITGNVKTNTTNWYYINVTPSYHIVWCTQ